MLPLMALPLLMGATSTGVTVATDLAFGVYHATQGKWGDMDDAAAGLIGSKNDSFVACCSEALVHGLITHSPLTAIPRAIYNGVRGIGEFIQGDYIDAFVHCSSALTGFDCVTNLVSNLKTANNTLGNAKTTVHLLSKQGASISSKVKSLSGTADEATDFAKAFGITIPEGASKAVIKSIKRAAKNSPKKVANAQRVAAQAQAHVDNVARQGLRNISSKAGTSMGSIYKETVDPFANFFKKARAGETALAKAA